MAGVVKHADAFFAAQFRAERADRVDHLVSAGVQLEVDLKAQSLQFARDTLGIIARILERRVRILGIADHERQARQRVECRLRLRGHEPAATRGL